jgi:hypothetical protein
MSFRSMQHDRVKLDPRKLGIPSRTETSSDPSQLSGQSLAAYESEEASSASVGPLECRAIPSIVPKQE